MRIGATRETHKLIAKFRFLFPDSRGALLVITPVATLLGMVWEIKLRKIGNSVGVVLPKEALAHLNLREGDKVCVTGATDGSLRLAANNAEFSLQMEIAKDVMQRYRNTLRELAK